MTDQSFNVARNAECRFVGPDATGRVTIISNRTSGGGGSVTVPVQELRDFLAGLDESRPGAEHE